MNRRRLRSCSGDRGAAAIEMPLAVGLLLLPIAIVVMLVPQWPERQTVARAAAKDAATIYANAPDAESGARPGARQRRDRPRRTTVCRRMR